MPFNDPLGATIEGYFQLYSGFAQDDATRPLRWQLNADGVVNLFGWVIWRDSNTVVNANELRTFGGIALTGSPASPPGSRDMPGCCDLGILQYTVQSSGKLFFKPKVQVTLVQNVTWFSFDSVSWRNYAPGS